MIDSFLVTFFFENNQTVDRAIAKNRIKKESDAEGIDNRLVRHRIRKEL